jgi:cell wall-associated NlpC family hydrolase
MPSQRSAIAGLGLLLGVALALAGCGEARPGSQAARHAVTSAADTTTATPPHDPPAQVAGGHGAAGTAHEVADPEEAKSFPAQGVVHHASAATPAQAGEFVPAAGAQSTAQVRAELQQEHAVQSSERQTSQRALTPVPGGESIGGDGQLPIPAGVPEVVQKVVAGANAIADFPYVFGGGHGSFVDNAYDCSGSVSYALAAGGLLGAPETSGELESWGVPGPGRYITVFANAGHTYMYVDGWLFDTAGRSGPYASRWQVQPVDNAGYVERHYPGL